jgi:hypothetical protein
MTGAQMTGMAAQGPLPAGMLRIRQGSEERYIWPVHLPGWLALGWRVAGTEPPAPIAAAAAALPEPDDAKPASSRSRRGKRRRNEQERKQEQDQEQPPAATESAPEPSAISTDDLAVAAASATEPGDDPSAVEEVALTALPEGLLDDPLL